MKENLKNRLFEMLLAFCIIFGQMFMCGISTIYLVSASNALSASQVKSIKADAVSPKKLEAIQI